MRYYDFRNDTAAAGQGLADAWAVFRKPTGAVPRDQAAQWGRELRLTPSRSTGPTRR